MPMKTKSYDYLYHKPWYCQIARVQVLWPVRKVVNLGFGRARFILI